MPVKPKKTWIVIADGMHARILRQDKRGAPLIPALDEELIEAATTGYSRDLKSDAPGRAFTDLKNHEKQLFARRVAELINNAALRKTFDQLVLVAPPKTLGELRTQLGDAARKLIVGEIDRDLVKTPAPDLPEHLSKVLT